MKKTEHDPASEAGIEWSIGRRAVCHSLGGGQTVETKNADSRTLWRRFNMHATSCVVLSVALI